MTDKNKYDSLELASGTYETTLNRTFLSRKPWAPVDPCKVLSFMPGSVVELRVAVGDRVKPGQSLMLFRAMKMNNNIVSPVAGTVAAINVAAGDNVAKNTVMIELK